MGPLSRGYGICNSLLYWCYFVGSVCPAFAIPNSNKDSESLDVLDAWPVGSKLVSGSVLQ